MHKKFKKILSFALCLILLSACEEQDSMRPPQARIQPAPTDPVTSENRPACYLNACFETLGITKIADPKGDYAYPNPEDFSDNSMQSQYIKPVTIIDLSHINANTKLSSHFKVVDFMSAKKGRYALFSSDVASIIQFIRNEVNRPVHITSGYRSPGYNKRIDGSAGWSRHTYGDALDFSVEGLAISDLPDFCKKHGASFTLKYESHIHCDWRKSELDPAFYDNEKKNLDPGELQGSIAKMIANQSRIVLKSTENDILLEAKLAIYENEEGTPTHEWTARLPSGEIVKSTDAIFALPKLHGDYKIQVTIGGSIQLEEILLW